MSVRFCGSEAVGEGTSLGHRTKKSGTVAMMEQKVTQKSRSECLNTLRSPEGGSRETHKKGTLCASACVCVFRRGRTGRQVSSHLPSGVKRTVEATMKPSTSPTTTTQAMTEPKRHQLVTRVTPPSTPITTDTDRLTVGRRRRDARECVHESCCTAAGK